MSNARLSPLFTWRGAISSEAGPESATTRHVLLALSLYMSQKGDSCFPSLSTLASDTGLDKSTVSKHLKRAHNEGWIDKRKSYDDDGMRSGTEYYATIPDGVDHDQPPVDDDQRGVDDDQPNTSSNTGDTQSAHAHGEDLPPHAPSEQQVVEYGTSRAGMTEEECKKFWRHYSAIEWLDPHGRKITNWKLKLGNWDARQSKYTSSRDGSSQTSTGDGEPSRKTPELVNP